LCNAATIVLRTNRGSVDLDQFATVQPKAIFFLETSLGRETMSKRKLLIAFLAVTLAAPLGFVDAASAAKKKITYDEAWKLCKAELDKSGAPGTGISANERHTRGAGCMQKYGYKI
jgi:hypothetical protein